MRSALAGLLCVLGAATALAQVPLDGEFAASRACPAVQSIKKATNPGGVMVEPGKAYALRGKNRDAATHYWIEVEGAQPRERWVAVDCGAINGVAAPPPAAPVETGGDGRLPFYLLAVSWQPAFCEAMSGKPECASQREDRFDATHFTLHGLWPQPRGREFCGVDQGDVAADENHRWDALPEVRLPEQMAVELGEVMPGLQSHLERHEWIKHGTCYGRPAEIYFRDALKLMRELNASDVQAYFAGKIGKTIRLSDIRARFDEAFGPGAGERIRVACKRDGDRTLITEITLGLAGDVGPSENLARMLLASKPTDGGCSQGEIDAVGPQ